MNKTLAYIIPFALYVATDPLVRLLGGDIYLAYSLKVFLTLIALIFFFKQYKEIKLKWDWLSCIAGVAIIAVWLLLERFYSATEVFTPSNSFILATKLIGMVLVAPFIEELFVRSFFIRFIINPDKWDKVKIGTYTLASFMLSVLFFGFSHGRWIAGLVVGILLNLWLYYKKDISSCIQAHMIANACLAIFAIYTQNWMIW